jgi:hypothetical protein
MALTRCELLGMEGGTRIARVRVQTILRGPYREYRFLSEAGRRISGCLVVSRMET